MKKNEPFLTTGWWLVVIVVSPLAATVGAMGGFILGMIGAAIPQLIHDVMTVLFVGM